MKVRDPRYNMVEPFASERIDYPFDCRHCKKKFPKGTPKIIHTTHSGPGGHGTLCLACAKELRSILNKAIEEADDGLMVCAKERKVRL